MLKRSATDCHDITTMAYLGKKGLPPLLLCLILMLMGPPVLADGTDISDNLRAQDTGVTAYPLKFFRSTISRADGHRCPMYPSCSEYSAQAFRKHGFIIGWIMTSDRLLRCGRDEKQLGEEIIIHNNTHVFDPLRNNDFWWTPR